MAKINESLENLTSNILLNNDLYKIPVNILKIAKANDITVFTADLEKKILGAIRYDKQNKKYTILLNEKQSYEQQRFTLAHELGHFFLHKQILESEELHVDIMYKIEDEQEAEVDYFAGALLMNKLLLEKMYEKNQSIRELAEMFEVSVSVMTIRLDTIGLI
jgi:Zn-dependent peptidase ImmA (M78 family)|nr:MAG TPA: IrrE protein [Caudoviricetes sp.]